MSRTLLSVTLIGSLFFIVKPLLLGQAPSQGVEQQLRSQYRVASVRMDGGVVRAGSVLVVAQDGIKANPPSGIIYWYNSHKPGNRIKYSVVFEATAGDLKDQVRLLQVGEKVLLARLEVKPSEVEFYVQTNVDSPNDAPFRACVVFQFQQKGYVQPANLKAIQDSIAEVFSLDTAGPNGELKRKKPGLDRPEIPLPTLKLPSTYVSAQSPADQLQLNADNSFSLQEGGQAYRGTFVVNSNTLEINIPEGDIKTTMTIQGNNLTGPDGKTWALREQSAQPPSDVIRNEDIIKMAKAGFDDAIIVAKIGSSKCQFDTSTDALIQLKQSGVSAAVLKAVVATGK